MTSRTRIFAALAVVVPALAIPASVGATTLIGSGSSAEQPILTALIAAYHHVQPKVKFIFTADGGNAGAKDVQQGRSQFAINTRAPEASDAGLTYYKIFKDGLCIAVNPANHLTNISTTQAEDIFLGDLTSWSSLPGSGLTSTIAPFGRGSSAGSYTFFQSVVLGGATQAGDVAQESTDGEVATAVKGNPAGIGYRARTLGYGERRQAAGRQRRRVRAGPDQVEQVPPQPLHLVRPAAQEAEHGSRGVRDLDPHEDRRNGDQQGRRRGDLRKQEHQVEAN